MEADTTLRAEVIVIGGGLAGLVAAAELAEAGKQVLLLEQEPDASLGGQAFWSLGGLFLVDSPEQRRARIKDSFDLAWSDWQGTAGFDRDEDAWPRRVARAYVEFAAGEKRAWLAEQGISLMPSPGWAERGGGDARGHGNSVPRFHLTWGTGPAVVAPFEAKVRAAAAEGRLQLAFRHQVDELVVSGGTVQGVRGSVLAPSAVRRGERSSREVVGAFTAEAPAVIITSGGIGHNFDLVRKYWPKRLGSPPKTMIAGVPEHVDGRMLEIAERAGAGWIGRDRMWHYVEGIRNWNPIWAQHGIRILPAPSSMWFDASGERLPAPLLPGFDTLATLEHIGRSGYDYTWFILTRKIIEKEFGLSGSEQNPDITGQSVPHTLHQRIVPGVVPRPIQAFMDHGRDFIVDADLDRLVARMNELAAADAAAADAVAADAAAAAGDVEVGEAGLVAPVLDPARIRAQIVARDRQLDNPYGKDFQVMAIRSGRKYLPDRIQRIAAPHKLLDPAAGPLIAVKLNILTRKTLGGLHTDLEARVLDTEGRPIDGLYAAGEVAGFGGGGMHGYNALEGTFLGGCLFSGRTAGRAVAARL